MAAPTTLDLFAGAGGITEGFRQAGYQCVFANDFSEEATKTFELNHPDTECKTGPIEELKPASIRKGLALAKGELDVLVGGPPCQGFSINAPERFLKDPRNALFRHYLRFVDEFAPKKLLMENVPGMLSLGGGSIYDAILGNLQDRGYSTSVKILLAANYGAPQIRWRTIILGSRCGSPPEHPAITHYHRARPNFKGGSTIALRPLPLDEFNLPAAVTLKDAIWDLPKVEAGGGDEKQGYSRSRRKPSSFAKEMREGSDAIWNHTANAITQINQERLAHIPPGGAWTSIPHDLLPKGMQRARRSDHTMRYGRLTWDSLSGTVMTKCDPHWGAVYHPEQPRTFTVRECARFQTFPDRYRFLGSRVAQFEQVGNAVPVVMARAIAEALLPERELAGKEAI